MDEMQTGQKVEEAKPKGMFLVIIVASLVVGLLIGYAVGLSVNKVSDQISLTKNDLEYIEYDYDQPSFPQKVVRAL